MTKQPGTAIILSILTELWGNQSMGIKVTKFGGSSLADASQFKKVIEILRADEERRYVVPSAPGKRFKEDDKITDLLYHCYDLATTGKNIDVAFEPIRTRYTQIVRSLGFLMTLPRSLTRSTAILPPAQKGLCRLARRVSQRLDYGRCARLGFCGRRRGHSL